MPTYELRCRECGHEFDLFLLRLMRDGDRVCPECDSTEVERGVGGGVLGSGTKSRPATGAEQCGSRGFG